MTTQANHTPDFSDLIRAYTATFSQVQCQDYIDLADVDFTPGDVLGRWQAQITNAAAAGLATGEDWAIELLMAADEHERRRRANMATNVAILEGV